MEIVVEKYAILLIKKRRKSNNERNRIVKSEKNIKTIVDKENYKYPGILKADAIKKTETKEKVQKEYLVVVNEKKQSRPNSRFFCPCRPQSKIKRSEKREKYLNPARELKRNI